MDKHSNINDKIIQNDSHFANRRNSYKFIEGAPQKYELVISYQVVNETSQVLKKKGLSEPELRLIIDGMFRLCEVSGFTQSGAALASELRETLSISYWDSHIVASAILAGCGSLISEDFQDGAIIRGMQVKNPFIV
ncbi:MAG: PIN domain-containing protein [Clostridiales bacterium]|jgi:predicted nucleic acid-binding protein|nr:PIN domain-containing protein [Clostridiales bacterium]